jgi:hypothetical protein
MDGRLARRHRTRDHGNDRVVPRADGGALGGRLLLLVPTTVFFSVWFGIALVVDLWRSRRTR